MSNNASPMGVPSVSDLEQTMSQIQGIYAARVVFNANYELSEVHLVASMDRPPKQVRLSIIDIIESSFGHAFEYEP